MFSAGWKFSMYKPGRGAIPRFFVGRKWRFVALKLKLLSVGACVVLMALGAAASPAWERVASTVKVFPEASYDGDFKLFAFQKNSHFQEKYSCETSLNVDLAFVGVAEKFFWMFRAELGAGCGSSSTGLVLHPYDVSYSLEPTLEYRFKNVHLGAGLDHSCFHEIDRKPREPIVYWNKAILTLNSPHRRNHPYVARYTEGDNGRWGAYERLIWSFTWGYYIREFFGLIAPYKVMSPERPHYMHDFELSVRYGLARWRWGAVTLTGASLLGFKHSDEGRYWAQQIGAEALFGLRPFDTSLFVNYVFDKGRFNSRDRLFEYGIRVVK